VLSYGFGKGDEEKVDPAAAAVLVRSLLEQFRGELEVVVVLHVE